MGGDFFRAGLILCLCAAVSRILLRNLISVRELTNFSQFKTAVWTTITIWASLSLAAARVGNGLNPRPICKTINQYLTIRSWQRRDSFNKFEPHPMHERFVPHKAHSVFVAFSIRLGSILIGAAYLVSCTVLDTMSAGSSKVDETKPQVGRYYMLPKALITIEGAPDKDGNYLVDTSVSLVADSRFRYFLYWKSNPFSEDIINNLDVDSDGMLTSVNYSSEDKTPQILSDLVTTTVNIAKIAKTFGAALVGGAVTPLPFTYTFDPFDEAEARSVKNELSAKQHFELQISPWPSGTRTELGSYLNRKIAGHPRIDDPQSGGVFYHPPTTVEMLLIDQAPPKKPNTSSDSSKKKNEGDDPAASPTASPTASPSPPGQTSPSPNTGKAATQNSGVKQSPSTTGSGNPQPIQKPATLCHVVVTVPDVDKVACLRLGRSFLTKRESNLGFAHGMPTTFVFKQPSGVQAFTGTLSSISGIVAAAVPSLIDVKSTSTVTPQKAVAQPVSTVATKTPLGGGSTGGKALSPALGNVGADDTVAQLQSQIDAMQQELAQKDNDNATFMKNKADTIAALRAKLIDALEKQGMSIDDINQVLKQVGSYPIPTPTP